MSAVTIDHRLVPVRRARSHRPADVVPLPVRQAPAAVAGGPAVPLRITRRGRLTLMLVLSAVLAVAGLGAAGQALAGPDAAPPPMDTVVVLPGDTLWGIASGVAAPGEDVRDVIVEIRTLNGLSTSAVNVGQELLVPATP
ncbi:LysM peptidoglycan-binding domain-containing protein [Quadrisphaera sp. GCM10027208]|uniref:LysM peptidoglycan-binding domain-containing protein n=1 Tax=Quadrisphaera sp. GCM10027208 TaxID=3273423 RepID=UPI003622A5FB